MVVWSSSDSGERVWLSEDADPTRENLLRPFPTMCEIDKVFVDEVANGKHGRSFSTSTIGREKPGALENLRRLRGLR
jgi:hypothetical protein